MARNDNERLIFLDCETSGTDEENDELFEVAAVITGPDLEELGVYESVIWAPDPVEIKRRVSPFIMKMHAGDRERVQEDSLFHRLQHAEKDTRDVEKELLTFFHDHGVRPNKGILAGNSIHFDRGFLKKNMPLLEAFFYHRMFDVSALKTAAQMWCPEILGPAPKTHRALADVRASIALAKQFKPIFEALKAGGRPDIDHFISEIARDFGESLPTKTEVLTRRLRELVVRVLMHQRPQSVPSRSSYGD